MCGWLDGLDNTVVFTSVFTEEKWLLSFAHLDTTPSSISLCLTVPANSLTPCLLTFLMKLSTGGGQSWHVLDITGRPGACLAKIVPLSLKFLKIQ